MKTTQIINGVTAKIEVEKDAKRSHLTSFKSLEAMVKDMTKRDVIHKFANIGEDFYTVDLEKTDEANDNWGENLSELSDSDLLALIEEKTTYEGDHAQLFAAIVRQFDLSLNDFDDVEINDNRITVQGIDYVAGTDDEMDTIAEEEISQSVWAFNASFLAQQTEFDQEIFEALQPKCEGANDAILKIINKTCGIEGFAEAAIKSDGRGHFLNRYDGTEDEKNFNGTTYYFCRS